MIVSTLDTILSDLKGLDDAAKELMRRIDRAEDSEHLWLECDRVTEQFDHRMQLLRAHRDAKRGDVL